MSKTSDTDITVIKWKQSMFPLCEDLMGISLKKPFGEVLGIYESDNELFDEYGYRAYFLIKSGSREVAVPVDAMLACLKGASDHGKIPEVPIEWWRGIASGYEVESCGTHQYGGKPLYEYKARQSHDCPTKDINFENYKGDYLYGEPFAIHSNHGFDSQYFAVCPSCLNPIRLFGIIPLHDEDYAPYGQHVYQYIDAFDINEAALRACPLH